MVKVSIIIPYFKKKNYIYRTIKSILKQTYQNFEIIIIYDDTDIKDLQYLKNLIKFETRIKLIINKKNLGAGKSRNKGIKIAKGKYIAFLDADDLWNINKLKIQIEFMEKNKYSITHTDYQILNKNKKIKKLIKARLIDHESLIKSCDIGLSTVIIKKKLLEKNLFHSQKTKEDYILWLKLTKLEYKFYPLNINLTTWRNVSDSLSSSIIQKIIDGYSVYRYFLKQSVVKSLINLFVLSLNSLKK